MTDQEKIALIAEGLDVDPTSIDAQTNLADLAEYDSMTKLSIIVLMDEEFDKKLTGEEIANFTTVGDIVAFAG